MSNNGWICLYRQIRDNWIWNDAEKLKAWLDLLLEVNHEDKQIPFNNHIITIHRGQKLTSLRKLSERWGWSRNRVAHFIDLLVEAEMVTANRTVNGTLLTVVNYDNFQSGRDTNRATNEATIEATNGATNEATIEAQTTMNNNNNNSNNSNNFLSGASAQKKSAPPTQKDIEAYCQEKGYKMDVLEFMEYYRMREWELTGGKKVTKSNFKAAVDYWNRKGKKLAGECGDNVAYFEEYVPDIRTGTESPFEGSLVDELKRRRS